MPTYEYVCKSCGDRLEVHQGFSDEPLTECPRCEGPLRKVFGNIGITFKGSGFYKTDSRSSGGSKRSSSGSGDSSSSDSGSSSSDSGSSSSDSGSSGSSTPAAAGATS